MLMSEILIWIMRYWLEKLWLRNLKVKITNSNWQSEYHGAAMPHRYQ